MNQQPRRKTMRGGAGCPSCRESWSGGAATVGLPTARGGYRATARNRQLLAKLHRGESIGFTATASLKAKGLIPRTSRKYRGKKILGPKYR
jgi:hypothetical protein